MSGSRLEGCWLHLATARGGEGVNQLWCHLNLRIRASDNHAGLGWEAEEGSKMLGVSRGEVGSSLLIHHSYRDC